MKALDIIILLIIGLCVFLAVKSYKKGKGHCDGNCYNCIIEKAKKDYYGK